MDDDGRTQWSGTMLAKINKFSTNSKFQICAAEKETVASYENGLTLKISLTCHTERKDG